MNHEVDQKWLEKLEAVKGLVNTIERPAPHHGYYDGYPTKGAVQDKIRVARMVLSELSKEI